jgi:surface antigen
LNATGFIPALIAIAALAAQPAEAQFLGIGPKKSDSSTTTSQQQCQPSEARKQRNSLFGSIAGSIAGSALGRAGAGGAVVSLAVPVGSLLSTAIIEKLDCKEQVQAAEATNNAVRGGVGTSSTWKSETRANVSGTSTVTGEDKLADGSSCVTVTDVIIVDGEETTAPKRMCRKPGESGYVLAAA